MTTRIDHTWAEQSISQLRGLQRKVETPEKKALLSSYIKERISTLFTDLEGIRLHKSKFYEVVYSGDVHVFNHYDGSQDEDTRKYDQALETALNQQAVQRFLLNQQTTDTLHTYQTYIENYLHALPEHSEAMVTSEDDLLAGLLQHVQFKPLSRDIYFELHNNDLASSHWTHTKHGIGIDRYVDGLLDEAEQNQLCRYGYHREDCAAARDLKYAIQQFITTYKSSADYYKQQQIDTNHTDKALFDESGLIITIDNAQSLYDEIEKLLAERTMETTPLPTGVQGALFEALIKDNFQTEESSVPYKKAS